MRNKFFFGAFAVLVVLFLFFMFFVRPGRAQGLTLPKPGIGAPASPAVATIPPAANELTSKPAYPTPVVTNPLLVEEASPAPPNQLAPGNRPEGGPANDRPDPAGATIPAPPDGPSYV